MLLQLTLQQHHIFIPLEHIKANVRSDFSPPLEILADVASYRCVIVSLFLFKFISLFLPAFFLFVVQHFALAKFTVYLLLLLLLALMHLPVAYTESFVILHVVFT